VRFKISEPPKTVRFWQRFNDSWVKLSLTDQERVIHHSGGPTDEGWENTTHIYKRCGCMILLDIHWDARDCDGRASSHHEFEFSILSPWRYVVRLGDGGTTTMTSNEARPATGIPQHSRWSLEKGPQGKNMRLPDFNLRDSYHRDHAAEAAGY